MWNRTPSSHSKPPAEDRFEVLRDDFSLHNLLHDINQKDVERVTRGEALVIQGKRRKVRIPNHPQEEEAHGKENGRKFCKARGRKLAQGRQNSKENPRPDRNFKEYRNVLRTKPSLLLLDRMLGWKDYLVGAPNSGYLESQMGDGLPQESAGIILSKRPVGNNDRARRTTGHLKLNIQKANHTSPEGPLQQLSDSSDFGGSEKSTADRDKMKKRHERSIFPVKVYRVGAATVSLDDRDDESLSESVTSGTDLQTIRPPPGRRKNKDKKVSNLDDSRNDEDITSTSDTEVSSVKPQKQKKKGAPKPGFSGADPRNNEQTVGNAPPASGKTNQSRKGQKTSGERAGNSERFNNDEEIASIADTAASNAKTTKPNPTNVPIEDDDSSDSASTVPTSTSRRNAGAAKPEKTENKRTKNRNKKPNKPTPKPIKVQPKIPEAPSISSAETSNPPSPIAESVTNDDVESVLTAATSITTLAETEISQSVPESRLSQTSNVSIGRSSHEYFRDSEISSHSNLDVEPVLTEDEAKGFERDNEWLQCSDPSNNEYEDKDEETANGNEKVNSNGYLMFNHFVTDGPYCLLEKVPQGSYFGEAVISNGESYSSLKETKKEDDCQSQNMMRYVLPLFRLMKLAGRLPVTIKKDQNSVHVFGFDRGSIDFNIFCTTSSFMTFCCLSMFYNLYSIFTTPKPTTFYEDILALEFDKYWLEGVLTAVSLYISSTWGFATMFETGIFLSEYLTRWNLCIRLLKYDVTERLRAYLIAGYVVFGLYTTMILLLFFLGGEGFPTVKGASGFIAVLIFQPFVFDLRVQPWYFIAEYVGLAIHLYSVLSCGFILMLIMVYAKALENGARRFNLRLAYALRQIALPDENQEFHTVHRVIPYGKLFSEHIVITSFSRHLGKTFAVALNAFYSTKVVAMIVTLYVFAYPFLNGFPQFNETYLNVSGSRGSTGVPILNAEPKHVLMGKSIYLLWECWLVFFLFSEVISKTGDTIMDGFGFIRRHGTFKCKSATERRFMLSMQHSFAPTNSYYINPSLSINREAVLTFVGCVLTIWVFLIQFSPARLKTTSTIICNRAGECRMISYRRNWELSVVKIKPPPIRPTAPTVSTPSTLSTTTLLPPPGITNSPKPGRFSYPPCIPNGATPIDMSDFAFNCNPELTEVFQPLLYERKIIGQSTYYDLIPPACVSSSNVLPSVIYDCFGAEVSFTENTDECQKIKLGTPDLNGNKFDPEVELALVRIAKFRESLYCCYKYKQLETQAIRSCNLISLGNAKDTCTKSPSPERLLFESLFWRKVRARMLKAPRNDLQNDWDGWIQCICQDTIQVVPAQGLCKNLILQDDFPPCSVEFSNSQPFNGTWGPERCTWNEFRGIPVGRKMQLMYSRDEWFQYTPILTVGSNCTSNAYDDTSDLTSIQAPDIVTDCFGNAQPVGSNAILRTRDDCRNLKLENVPGFTDIHLVYDFGSQALRDEVFCCYSWNAGRPCNFPRTAGGERTLRSICGSEKNTERSPYERRMKDWIKDNGNQLLEPEKWSDCICQGVGDPNGSPGTWDPTRCVNLPDEVLGPGDVPYCDPRFPTTVGLGQPQNWNARWCPWNDFTNDARVFRGVKMQLLYQKDLATLRYTPIIPQGKTCTNTVYPDNFDLAPYQRVGIVVTDCFGKIQRDNSILKTRDDCKNIHFPNAPGFNVGFGYNLSHDVVINGKLFCCYVFGLPQTSCNLPIATLIPTLATIVKDRCVQDQKSKAGPEYLQFETQLISRLNQAGNPLTAQERRDWATCVCQNLGVVGTQAWDNAKCTPFLP